MSNAIESIAQSVASAIGGSVDYLPEFERRDLSTERLVVVPSGIEDTLSSRAAVQTDYNFSVGLLKRINGEEDIPQLVARVRNIGRSLLGATFGGARCVAARYEPLYSLDLVREARQFTGVIKITLRTFV